MTTHSSPDSITASVIRSAMETVCFEMVTYVSRTATTPILNQSNERNATILDQTGRLGAPPVGAAVPARPPGIEGTGQSTGVNSR